MTESDARVRRNNPAEQQEHLTNISRTNITRTSGAKLSYEHAVRHTVTTIQHIIVTTVERTTARQEQTQDSRQRQHNDSPKRHHAGHRQTTCPQDLRARMISPRKIYKQCQRQSRATRHRKNHPANQIGEDTIRRPASARSRCARSTDPQRATRARSTAPAQDTRAPTAPALGLQHSPRTPKLLGRCI